MVEYKLNNLGNLRFFLAPRINENECGKEGKYYNEGEPANSYDFPSL